MVVTSNASHGSRSSRTALPAYSVIRWIEEAVVREFVPPAIQTLQWIGRVFRNGFLPIGVRSVDLDFDLRQRRSHADWFPRVPHASERNALRDSRGQRCLVRRAALPRMSVNGYICPHTRSVTCKSADSRGDICTRNIKQGFF